MCPIFDGETTAVGPPIHFVVGVNAFATLERTVDAAFLLWRWVAVFAAVMAQGVHILPKQLLGGLIAEHAEARGIAEGAVAFEINAVDGLGG